MSGFTVSVPGLEMHLAMRSGTSYGCSLMPLRFKVENVSSARNLSRNLSACFAWASLRWAPSNLANRYAA